jgi:hypothetical protein
MFAPINSAGEDGEVGEVGEDEDANFLQKTRFIFLYIKIFINVVLIRYSNIHKIINIV